MKVEVKNNAVEITTTIPLMMNDEGFNACNPKKASEIVSAFRTYLITLIGNRMEACIRLLRSHLNDVFYNNGYTIAWHRKDKTIGYFNIPGYQVMKDAVELLKNDECKKFMESKPMVDQAIKAIMNDPNLDHSDAGPYKFSELVSVLCEIHCVQDPCYE
jgi:hypothetical protein